MFIFLERELWITCIFCELTLCVALIKRGLLGSYFCLFGLGFVNAIRDIVLFVGFGTAHPMYARAWVITLPILMAVQVAAVLEAYTKLIGQYSGLAAFASKMLRCCVAISVALSCILVAGEFDHLAQSMLDGVLFTYRYFAFVLGSCLVFPCIFLSWFPKPEKKPARNIMVHLWMLTCYFSVYIVGFFLINLSGIHEKTITIINVGSMAVLCGLYTCWAFVLTPLGETSVPWPRLAPHLISLIDVQSDEAIHRARELSHHTRPKFSKDIRL